MVAPSHPKPNMGPWDDEHVKALLRFPRFPMRLIQQEPWQSWIAQRGGLKAVYTYLKEYPLPPSHRRILEVVLSNPEAVSNVYADRLNISRATYFYQLRQLIPALVQALNEWQSNGKQALANHEEIATSSPILPVPITSLVGTDSVLQSLEHCLQREDVRLLTLLGPGGIGKTRLAIALAQRLSPYFNNQVCFVDLFPLDDAGKVASRIAQSLGLKQTNPEALRTYLSPRTFLLILDNFEHLLPARALLAELLVTAPRLKILVTSRIALYIYGEHQFIVPPLALPADNISLEAAAQIPSVALFVQRAQEVNPNFTLTRENLVAVTELCHRMEGLPLAIEWAAFQTKYFSPQALLIRMANKRCIDFLSQTPQRLLPAHQQTMRAVFDWSYNLLTSELQTFLNRLAIFPQSFTLEAAETICRMPATFDVPAGLASLIDHSLVTQDSSMENGEVRFCLSAMLREYGLEKLEADEDVSLYQRAHAEYYLHLVEQRNSLTPPDAGTSMEKLSLDYTNFKTAIQWALDNNEKEIALRLIAALWEYWLFWGNPHEGYQLAQTAIERSHDLYVPVRADVLRQIGWLACESGDTTSMLWAFQNSLEISINLHDSYGIGLSLQGLGELARLQGHWEQARDRLQKCLALFQELRASRQIARTLELLGRLEFSMGNLAEAETYLHHSLAWLQPDSNQYDTPSVLVHLGQTLFHRGALEQSALVFEKVLYQSPWPNPERAPLRALALHYLGEIALWQNADYSRAQTLLEQSLSINRQNGYKRGLELNYFALSLLALQINHLENTAAWLRESLSLQQSIREPWRCITLLETTATLLVQRGELVGAARLYGIAASLRAKWRIAPMPIYQSLHAPAQRTLQQLLGNQALENTWDADQTLSPDQALTYALRCLEPLDK